MPFDHAGLLLADLPATHFIKLCEKKKIRTKSIITLKAEDGSELYHILEFLGYDDMTNACTARLLDCQIVPLKSKKSYTKPVLHARPRVGATHASAEIKRGKDVGARDIDEIREAIHNAIDDGKLCPSDEREIPIVRIYGKDFKAAAQSKILHDDDMVGDGLRSTALFVLQGDVCQGIKSMFNGALRQSAHPACAHSDGPNQQAAKSNQPKRKPAAKPPHAQPKPAPANQPAAIATKTPAPALASPQPHVPAPAARSPTPSPARPAPDLSEHRAKLDLLQRLLPDGAPYPAPVPNRPGDLHCFFLVPCAVAGAVIGANSVHLASVVAQAPVSRIRPVDAVYAAPAPPESVCLRVVGTTRAGLTRACGLLRERAALVMAWTRPGLCRQGPAWVPPQAPSAAILPTPPRPAGVTSYGAAGPHDNAQLRHSKALLNSAATACGGGGGGGGGKKKGRAGRKAAGRARPEERERERQARDGSGSPEGGAAGLWLLCLDASAPAGGPAPPGPHVLRTPDAPSGPSGPAKGKGRAGPGRAGRNRFEGLPVEPASGLDGMATEELRRLRRKLGKVLAETDAVVARRAGGARLERQQEGKAARRGEVARALERVEEALLDRAST